MIVFVVTLLVRFNSTFNWNVAHFFSLSLAAYFAGSISYVWLVGTHAYAWYIAMNGCSAQKKTRLTVRIFPVLIISILIVYQRQRPIWFREWRVREIIPSICERFLSVMKCQDARDADTKHFLLLWAECKYQYLVTSQYPAKKLYIKRWLFSFSRLWENVAVKFNYVCEVATLEFRRCEEIIR